MRRRGALVLVSPYHLISHSASAAPSPLTCRGHLALPQREAHPGLLPPGVLTSILRTASSMAADVAAISLSTIAPSSSSRTSRLLGFSSWGDEASGSQAGWMDSALAAPQSLGARRAVLFPQPVRRSGRPCT